MIPLGRIADLSALRYEATDLSKPPERFTLFDPDSYEEIHEEPQAHREYLNSSVQAGKVPLLYFTIPHVLVAGPIDTAGLSLVDWTVPLPG
jgi:hypothetical protein